MRNKIPCSADRLGLLDPQMIQGVSDPSAFQIGHQYLTENRVRIVEADEAQIASAVIGNSGLYEQTIRLKDGHLLCKCTCTLPEEPMCRHCIAVLLEYHRWAQPRQPRRNQDSRDARPQSSSADHTGNGKPGPQPGATDLKLSEVMQFVEWLQPAVAAIEKGASVPEMPPSSGGQVAQWIQAIRQSELGRRQADEAHTRLQAEMRDREAYVGRLTQQLQASIAEAKAAQAMSQEQQAEVALYKGMLAKVGELAGEVGRYDVQIKAVAAEILGKGSQLEKLAHSFKEVADALKNAGKQTPPH
jgi:hypothetical protein